MNDAAKMLDAIVTVRDSIVCPDRITAKDDAGAPSFTKKDGYFRYCAPGEDGMFNHQWMFRFPNNFGMSVVRGPTTYGGEDGLFEVGLIWFYSEANNDDWELVDAVGQDTKFFQSDTVEGHLTEEAVEKMVDLISSFKEDE